MIKKIAVLQLRTGMHLLRLEGAWLDHPFWRTRFVIQDPADLKRLLESGVTEVWIDTALGLDVAATVTEAVSSAAQAAPVPAPPPPPPPPPPSAAAPPAAAQRPATLASELKQAAAICNRGREAVTAMFNEARMGRTIDAERCLPLV